MTLGPDPNAGSGIIAGFQQAAGVPPIQKRDVATGLAEYGLKPAKLKGQSDQQLYQMAVNAVVNWKKARMKAATTPAPKPAANKVPTPKAAAKPKAVAPKKPAAPKPLAKPTVPAKPPVVPKPPVKPPAKKPAAPKAPVRPPTSGFNPFL